MSVETLKGSRRIANNRILRKLLIYPRFQLLLIGINGFLMVTLATVFALGVRYSFASLREMGVQANLVATHPYFRFLEWQSGKLYGYLAVALLVGVLVSTIVTLVLSHKLAGPVIRLRSHFRGIEESGRPAELRFRKGDFFPDLPATINAAVTKISRHE